MVTNFDLRTQGIMHRIARALERIAEQMEKDNESMEIVQSKKKRGHKSSIH